MHARRVGAARRGFSLIEVTITMLVIGIMAAAAAPSYFSVVASKRAEMAACRIVADLSLARSQAQQSSQSRTVEFDVPGNQYSLLNVDRLDRSTASHVVNLIDEPFSSQLVTATFGVDAIVIFDMYGRPDSEGTITVQSGNVLRTVTVSPDGSATY